MTHTIESEDDDHRRLEIHKSNCVCGITKQGNICVIDNDCV